jgi:hypothetical protein
MPHQMINAAVAQSRHDDMIREVNSPEGQLRSRFAYERRLRRASLGAGLRDRLVRFLRRQPRVEQHELAA